MKTTEQQATMSVMCPFPTHVLIQDLLEKLAKGFKDETDNFAELVSIVGLTLGMAIKASKDTHEFLASLGIEKEIDALPTLIASGVAVVALAALSEALGESQEPNFTVVKSEFLRKFHEKGSKLIQLNKLANEKPQGRMQ